ncbi:hypothetical protein [Aurantimonas sp. 22II-16-19i]|uniref:hypothetical protein n=1 Tax=Aurantimonas sp. 22II-16-19i TaxID=1317114 RepID=UPI0009F7A44E|nr:hypothetical protein [Aurantimonas sp. 22II-16-19i]ORE97642.1 hypothetical protein ATO4_08485 [Aurantimonas sp. 22II-16-19i]
MRPDEAHAVAPVKARGGEFAALVPCSMLDVAGFRDRSWSTQQGVGVPKLLRRTVVTRGQKMRDDDLASGAVARHSHAHADEAVYGLERAGMREWGAMATGSLFGGDDASAYRARAFLVRPVGRTALKSAA